MPSLEQFYTRLLSDDEFLAQYKAARYNSGYALLEMMYHQLHGNPISPVDVAQRKLIVDSVKWILAKHNPSEYGDRKQIDSNINVQGIIMHSGDDLINRIKGEVIDIAVSGGYECQSIDIGEAEKVMIGNDDDDG
jgi:hypothetical protein